MSAHPPSSAESPESSAVQAARPHAAGAPRLGAGSWLLASALQRMGAAVLVSAALWILTGWAMQWW